MPLGWDRDLRDSGNDLGTPRRQDIDGIGPNWRECQIHLMDTRISVRDVREVTYAEAVGEEAHEVDHKSDHPVNVLRREAS